MKIWDKILFKDNPDDSSPNSSKKEPGLPDWLFKDKSSSSKTGGGWSSIFFKEGTDTSPNRRRFLDIFFKDDPELEDDSNFVDEERVLDDIPSKIQFKKSELTKIGELLRLVDPTEYPDSIAEYESYLSLMKKIEELEKDVNSGDEVLSTIHKLQLETEYRKFESNYTNSINSIRSLCYVNEIQLENRGLKNFFYQKFTQKTESEILESSRYITLIREKRDEIDKKYAARLDKALIEAEYWVKLLSLMVGLESGREPKRNPFLSIDGQKKKIFETYISRDIKDASNRYNLIADSKSKYIQTGLVKDSDFQQIEKMAELLSKRINKYSIDDFLLNELFNNVEGYETLKLFLDFQLRLNEIDSLTQKANERYISDCYNETVKGNGHNRKKDYDSSNDRDNRD